jgi:hypothetical protein
VSRWALRGSNCNPVRATSEVSTRWASVVTMALSFAGGAPPGSVQRWLSPFAFPALSTPILRRIIAARMRTAGVHRERITTTIRALKTRDPQLGVSMEETHLTFQSEAIGNIYPNNTLPFR